jgi:hypothetical protein
MRETIISFACVSSHTIDHHHLLLLNLSTPLFCRRTYNEHTEISHPANASIHIPCSLDMGFHTQPSAHTPQSFVTLLSHQYKQFNTSVPFMVCLSMAVVIGYPGRCELCVSYIFHAQQNDTRKI